MTEKKIFRYFDRRSSAPNDKFSLSVVDSDATVLFEIFGVIINQGIFSELAIITDISPLFWFYFDLAVESIQWLLEKDWLKGIISTYDQRAICNNPPDLELQSPTAALLDQLCSLSMCEYDDGIITKKLIAEQDI